MRPLALVLVVWLGKAKSVSVDPDLEEIPMQAETEDIFIFPSMKMNPLSLVRYADYS